MKNLIIRKNTEFWRKREVVWLPRVISHLVSMRSRVRTSVETISFPHRPLVCFSVTKCLYCIWLQESNIHTHTLDTPTLFSLTCNQVLWFFCTDQSPQTHCLIFHDHIPVLYLTTASSGNWQFFCSFRSSVCTFKQWTFPLPPHGVLLPPEIKHWQYSC